LSFDSYAIVLVYLRVFFIIIVCDIYYKIVVIVIDMIMVIDL